MAAITWQNINGPSLSEAARPLEGAQRSFDAMFNGFEGILKKRQDMETANWDQTKLNNTNALLGAVQNAKTPEEYAALEAGLREQMTGYGAQVDATAARAAMDTRLGTLQQRAKQAGEYKDWSTDQAEAPVTREIAAANARQDPLTANLLMNANPGLRTMPALAAAYTASQRQVAADAQGATTFANGQTKFAQEQLLYPSQVTKANNDLLIQEANISKIKAEAEKAAHDLKYGSKEDREAQTKAFQGRLDNTLMANGTFTSKKGDEFLSKGMTAMGLSPDNYQSVKDKINAKYPNGYEILSTVKGGKSTFLPLPTDLVMQAIAGTDDNITGYLGGTFGGRAADNLEKLLKNPVTRERLMEGYQAQIDFNTGGNNANTQIGGSGPDALPNADAIRAALTSVKANEAPKPGVTLADGYIKVDAALQKRLAAEAAAQKKSPEIAPVVAASGGTAVPLNRAATPEPVKGSKPSVVTSTEGFALGNPAQKTAPLDTSKVIWGQAEQVVKAGIEHRSKNAVVLTVAKDGVKDADTIKFNGGEAAGILNGVCRVDGIDARETAKSWKKNPEPGQAYGEEAAAVLQKMIDGKQLSVTVTQSKDGTGARSVCQIDIVGGDNLSAGLVKAGAAYLTEKYWKTPETVQDTGYRESLRVFQQDAIKNKLGMFGDTNPRKLDDGLPAAYRKRMKVLNRD